MGERHPITVQKSFGCGAFQISGVWIRCVQLVWLRYSFHMLQLCQAPDNSLRHGHAARPLYLYPPFPTTQHGHRSQNFAQGSWDEKPQEASWETRTDRCLSVLWLRVAQLSLLK